MKGWEEPECAPARHWPTEFCSAIEHCHETVQCRSRNTNEEVHKRSPGKMEINLSMAILFKMCVKVSNMIGNIT